MRVTAYTRRGFAKVFQAGAAMAAAGFRPSCLEGMIPTAGTSAEFSMQHFARLLGSEFRVASQTGSEVSLTLISVEEMPRRRPVAIASARTVDCALLRFSLGGSGGGGGIDEGIHRLAHERYGDYDLYLSPGKPGRYLAYLCGWPRLAA